MFENKFFYYKLCRGSWWNFRWGWRTYEQIKSRKNEKRKRKVDIALQTTLPKISGEFVYFFLQFHVLYCFNNFNFIFFLFIFQPLEFLLIPNYFRLDLKISLVVWHSNKILSIDSIHVQKLHAPSLLMPKFGILTFHHKFISQQKENLLYRDFK